MGGWIRDFKKAMKEEPTSPVDENSEARTIDGEAIVDSEAVVEKERV
mgnify:FL=1